MTIPFQERITCSVRDAMDASGFGKTKLFALIAAGRLETTKVDGKRLVRVKSLMQLLDEPDANLPHVYPQDESGLGRTTPNRAERQ